MKALTNPLSIAALAGWIVAFVLGQTAIAVAVLIAWIGIVALTSMRQSSARYAEQTAEELDAESRTMFTPIRRLVEQIEQSVAANQDSTTVRVIGAEALEEARRIKEQTFQALRIRGDLKRTMKGRSTAQLDAQELEDKVSEAATDHEREALDSAVQAKRLEISHYASIDDALRRIEAGVRQAEAALSELHARLLVSASGEKAELADDGSLRETVGRLKALSLSTEEAEQMLRQ